MISYYFVILLIRLLVWLKDSLSAYFLERELIGLVVVQIYRW